MNKMLCPSCKTFLEVTGQERLETLTEHCFDPNGVPSLKDVYECLNPKCGCFTVCMWDYEGAVYTQKGMYKEYKTVEFIDNNTGAFGSFTRQVNVEISKHDEDIRLPFFFGYVFVIAYKYKSNEDGDILSKKPFLQIIKNGVYIKYS